MLGHEDVRQAEESKEWKGRPFILTYTGKAFPFDEITPDAIDIRDIAHSLSQLCRFTGHTNMFYSVAQHSLLVSERMPGGPAAKLVGLLHDAAEAYTNDLASPLKRFMNDSECLGSVYSSLQDSITAMIYEKFGVSSIPFDVALYDGACCVFEAQAFLGLTVEELEKYQFQVNYVGTWQPWNPYVYGSQHSDREHGEIEVKFLERFEELMGLLGRET